MSKISYYGKRPIGQSSYNYNYGTYNHPYKKNYFKNKNKPGNNYINNYIEERKKNYSYYENPNSYYSFSQKTHFPRYNQYYTEEKKIEDVSVNTNINKDEKKDELLRIRVNVSDNQYKELVICKNDKIYKKVEEFCKVNFINDKLIGPIYNKINQSLNALKIINNFALNENDLLFLYKIKSNIGKNKNK